MTTSFTRIPGALALLFVFVLAPASLNAQKKGDSGIFAVERGGPFEGEIKARGKTWTLVETALGTRRLRSREIGVPLATDTFRQRYSAEVAKLEAEEKTTRKESAKKIEARFRLARWCRHVGLTSGLRDQLARILDRDPDHAGARKMIQQLAPAFRPARTNPTPPEKTRWARKEADLLWAGVGKARVVQAAILRERLGSLPAELTLGQAVKLVRKGKKLERWVAAQVLGDSLDKRRVKPLYVSALNDPVWQVREAAVDSLARRDDGTTIGPFAKVLLTNPRADRRLYAAEALGRLGDKRAVPALMRAMRFPPGDNGSPKARANIAVLRQVAYIKDYDVEVAQSAFIADPIVDIAQDGAVLDASVVAITTQRRVIGNALGTLTGSSFGGDAKRWDAWWKENRAKY